MHGEKAIELQRLLPWVVCHPRRSVPYAASDSDTGYVFQGTAKVKELWMVSVPESPMQTTQSSIKLHQAFIVI